MMMPAGFWTEAVSEPSPRGNWPPLNGLSRYRVPWNRRSSRVSVFSERTSRGFSR